MKVLFCVEWWVTMFIGRKHELASLNALQKNQKANLVVICGRRRIGKSRLSEEFASGQTFIRISGIAPTVGTTAQEQRDEFARQLAQQTNSLSVTASEWTTAFRLLCERIPAGKRVTVLLDEISWMGSMDHQFVSQLKDCWDFYFSKLPKLTLILCGSVSAWIEKEIVQSTAFVGRLSLNLALKQLSVNEANEFWLQRGNQNIKAFEKLKMLAITGGVPRYLELINPNASADENIKSLCFKPESPLVNEFNIIFTDIFGARSDQYRKIIQALAQGPKEQKEILADINLSKSGQTSEYLSELELAGFVSRDYSWQIKSGKRSNISRYRLQDVFLRFYLKYIEPNKEAIRSGLFYEKPLSSLSGWNTLLGLQFEALIQNNRLSVLSLLSLSSADVEHIGPYFQRPTKSRAGCQVDLLIQVKQNILYICEIKFSKNLIGNSVVKEMQAKLDNMRKPKGYSCVPILIHVNGVTDELEDAQFFYRIIDFTQILNGEGGYE